MKLVAGVVTTLGDKVVNSVLLQLLVGPPPQGANPPGRGLGVALSDPREHIGSVQLPISALAGRSPTSGGFLVCPHEERRATSRKGKGTMETGTLNIEFDLRVQTEERVGGYFASTPTPFSITTYGDTAAEAEKLAQEAVLSLVSRYQGMGNAGADALHARLKERKA